MTTVDEFAALGQDIAGMTDEQLRVFFDLCGPEDIALVEHALGQIAESGEAASIRSEPALLAAYVTRQQKQSFKLWRYVRLLSRQFVRLTVPTDDPTASKRQCWSMPPRYGKSLIGCRWGPSWLVETTPASKTILTSYAADLAESHAVFCRDTINANRDVFTVELSRSRQARHEFLTMEGGGIRASGFDGQITGFGAGNGGGIVIDDPFKNWPEAHRELQRNHVWDQWQGTLLPRLDDEEAFVLVIQTRWHEDDLIGRFMTREPERWEFVRLPAIAEHFDPDARDSYLRVRDLLDRAEGETLEPDRFSLAFEIERARGMGSYLASGLLQQRPSPPEGGEIKRGWWKWTSSLPTEHDTWCTSWDMKLKEKESGDYQVGQVWGRTGNAFFLHAQLRGQWTMLHVACAIALLAVRFPNATRHYIENTGNGPEVMSLLKGSLGVTFKLPRGIGDSLGMTPEERIAVREVMRRGLPGLVPITPQGDKLARARAVSAYVEAGDTFLPEGKDFAEALVDEAASFPNGTHDDMVDAWSQAMGALTGKIRVHGVAVQGDESPSQWR